MSSPSSNTDPASVAIGTSSCMRLSVRRKVDLPHPEGPISAVTTPASILMLTPSSTLREPNQQLTSTPSRTPPTGPAAASGMGLVCSTSGTVIRSVLSASDVPSAATALPATAGETEPAPA